MVQLIKLTEINLVDVNAKVIYTIILTIAN